LSDQSLPATAPPRALSAVTWVMLVGVPAALLILTQFLEVGSPTVGAPYDMVTLILLVVAVLDPLPYLWVERAQMKNFRKVKQNEVSRGRFFLSVAIMRMAPVASIYIFGFIVFIIGGELIRMLYFYPIGIAWTFFRWPTEAYREAFFRKLEVS